MAATKLSPVPPSGVWVPAVTFFDPETDTLLLEDQKKYFAYLASTGIAGLVVLGSNAEKFLLTREERRTLLEAAREAVGPDFPIMAGVSGHSTAQVREYLADAAAAGANYGLLLPAAYFGAKNSPPAMVAAFYDDVTASSPLPIVVYNFPGVCNGVDLDSDLVAGLARRHPGVIVGVKLTCGSVAKATRLVAELPADQFAVFAGQADFLLGALTVGAAGCITAFGNVAPKTVVKIYETWTNQKSGTAAGAAIQDTRTAEQRESAHVEALRLHQQAALAERPLKAGVAMTKYAAAVYTAPRAGIAGAEAKLRPRKPYLEPGDADKKRCRDMLDEMSKVEGGL